MEWDGAWMINTGRAKLNPIQIQISHTRIPSPENPFHSFSSPSPSPCVSPATSSSESVDSSFLLSSSARRINCDNLAG